MTHACLGFVVWPAHQEKGWWPRDAKNAEPRRGNGQLTPPVA